MISMLFPQPRSQQTWVKMRFSRLAGKPGDGSLGAKRSGLGGGRVGNVMAPLGRRTRSGLVRPRHSVAACQFRGLIGNGFRIARLMPVDQFAWTPHLELAALFRQ